MPYYNNKSINLLFIHIPKTGGTSIERYFSIKNNIPLDCNSLYMWLPEKWKKDVIINSSLQHMTYNTIMKYKDIFKIDFNNKNLEIITIVRNPYNRLISDLFFLGMINKDSTKEEVFNVIKNNYINNTNLDNHNSPQYLFITDSNKILIKNIKILHTEKLDKEMSDLGYKDFEKKENVNKLKLNYDNYLNNDSIKLINDLYNDDFILLNYPKKIVK